MVASPAAGKITWDSRYTAAAAIAAAALILLAILIFTHKPPVAHAPAVAAPTPAAPANSPLVRQQAEVTTIGHNPPALAEPPASSAPSESSKSGPAKVARPPLNQVVDIASAQYHLDPDLVNSVIHAESGFNSHAVSPEGARGLMQLMPDTANRLGVNDVFDPQSNVTGGCRYLRELLERYNFDLVKALAAYKAGPELVDQYEGVPPEKKTRAFVARVVHEYNEKKRLQESQLPCLASLAILRNFYSICHEHRLVMGNTTRLYFGKDDSSFTDVPTAEITGYKDPTHP